MSLVCVASVLLTCRAGCSQFSTRIISVPSSTDGELYNFRELRQELKTCGYLSRTETVTEVIVHAYEQWGLECLARFNGMCAFALLDDCNKQLFLACDRIGEKLVYHYRDQERLVFASVIKSILAGPAISHRLNLRGVSNFLASAMRWLRMQSTRTSSNFYQGITCFPRTGG